MLTEKLQPRKRGVRDVAIAIVAAALMMSPSYLGSIALHSLKLDISIVAIGALALFLVGVFLLLKLLKD